MYNVQIVDFKQNSPRATHVLNDDGSYTIFINSRLSYNQQRNSYLHEIEHIKNEDLYNHLDSDYIECIRHEGK